MVTDMARPPSSTHEKNDPEFWADLQKFIGPNAPLFIEVWRETPDGKLPAFKYFSIPAFLFGPFWFLYRKLYFVATAITVLTLAEFALAAATSIGFGQIVLIVTGMVIGIAAKKIYVNWAVQRVKAIRAAVLDVGQRQAEFKRQGGVSIKSIWVAIAAVAFLLVGLFFLIVIVFPPRWN